MPARTATARSAAEDREVIRLVAPVALWWVWLVFAAVNVADFAIQGLSSARFGAVVCAILLFVTGLAYTLALRPRVVTDSTGLLVVNPFRTHHVPWRLIQSVDTGEWVRVHYADLDDANPDNTRTKTAHCWALYVSARAKRKTARGPRPRRSGFFAGGGLAGRATEEAVFAGGDGSRLSGEAKRLASLPLTQAIAARLDTRAARERARPPGPARTPGQQPEPGQEPERATANWSVPALAAAVIPALVLLIVALV